MHEAAATVENFHPLNDEHPHALLEAVATRCNVPIEELTCRTLRRLLPLRCRLRLTTLITRGRGASLAPAAGCVCSASPAPPSLVGAPADAAAGSPQRGLPAVVVRGAVCRTPRDRNRRQRKALLALCGPPPQSGLPS